MHIHTRVSRGKAADKENLPSLPNCSHQNWKRLVKAIAQALQLFSRQNRERNNINKRSRSPRAHYARRPELSVHHSDHSSQQHQEKGAATVPNSTRNRAKAQRRSRSPPIWN